MFGELISIFINVVTPTFALVLLGYLVGPRLNLDARTLARFGYYILIPALIFDIISKAEFEAGSTLKMIAFSTGVQVICGVLAFVLARAMGHPLQVALAFVLLAIYGNVGNFGLAILDFKFGSAAIVPGTVYLVAITTVAFVVSIGTGSMAQRGGSGALLAIMKNPVILAPIPAIILQLTHTKLPLFATRISGLLGGAMVPVMLVTLGLQLAETRRPTINFDVLAASSLKLIVGPMIGMLLAIPFGLSASESAPGILQLGMPVAISTSVIAIEFDLAPNFVVTTVLFTTLASLLTLTVLLSVV